MSLGHLLYNNQVTVTLAEKHCLKVWKLVLCSFGNLLIFLTFFTGLDTTIASQKMPWSWRQTGTRTMSIRDKETSSSFEAYTPTLSLKIDSSTITNQPSNNKQMKEENAIFLEGPTPIHLKNGSKRLMLGEISMIFITFVGIIFL